MLFYKQFDELITEKALSMDFEHTENTEVLTQWKTLGRHELVFRRHYRPYEHIKPLYPA
jgi:hypothetical protein